MRYAQHNPGTLRRRRRLTVAPRRPGRLTVAPRRRRRLTVAPRRPGRLTVALLAAAVAGAALLLAPPATAHWRWPVDGPVLTTFRYGPDPFARGQRRGITIAAAAGTPIRSACDGVVRFRGSAGTAGRTVTVVCGRFTATYLHLATITAARGDRLRAGSRLGTVGRTGRPRLRITHLAFGVRRTGSRWAYVDPLNLLLGPDRPPPFTIGPAPRGRAPAVSPRPVVEGRRPAVPRPRPMPFDHSARPREPASGPAGSVPVVAWVGLGTVVAALVAWPARAVRRRRQLNVAVKGVPPLSQ